ncbi:MAG: hypothetical protein QXO70_04165 [Candidatus Pacearchaeota archaeon]
MAKLYFSKEHDDFCYQLDYWKEYMKKNNLKEIKLNEAKRESGTGYFFCKEFQEVGDVSESCGKFCEKYKPNNGKNGRCKHYGYIYDSTEKEITLKI